MLTPDASMHASVMERIRIASAVFAILAGLVRDRAIPLSLALTMYESKVDGCLKPGRWAYAVGADASATLDSLLDTWALTLLGSPPWHHAGAARCLLDWRLSGMARAVKEMALKRAEFWRLPDNDLYKTLFLSTQDGPPSAWAYRSKILLQQWRLADYADGFAGLGLASYKIYVNRELVTAGMHVLQVSLTKRSLLCGSQLLLRGSGFFHRAVVSNGLSWGILVGVRSWCRLRMGMLVLGHKNNRRTRARVQACIFCDANTSNPLFHTMAVCSFWHDHRVASLNALESVPARAMDAVAALFKVWPGQPSFAIMVDWACSIDRKAAVFWQ